MHPDFIASFDSRVAKALVSCGVDTASSPLIAVAVSGGCDSICLLTSLSRLLVPGRLIAVTVNHNIREESESAGDADFVESYCASIGIPCVRYDIPRGQIVDTASQEGLSLEESARNARYACFERLVKDEGVDFVALAHNRNDQLETIFMRFLSGGDVESLSGIRERRGHYIRPLLSISRPEIERYLEVQGISHRTDSSNADNSFFRNRVRNILLPCLDEHFTGWDTALLSMSEKMRDDGEFFGRELEAARHRCSFCKDNAAVTMDIPSFQMECRAVRIRLLFAAVESLDHVDGKSSPGRIPYSFLSRIADRTGIDISDSLRDSCRGIVFLRQKDILCIKWEDATACEKGFCVFVSEDGHYDVGGLSVFVTSSPSLTSGIALVAGTDRLVVPCLRFPFLIRSREPGDRLLAGDGVMRSVASIMDGWKCADKKDAIPLLQRLDKPEQDIVAIWGSPFAFKNWVVKY
ncbi:MAG: tRNA lysidine(34) synthetase TilS [Treponema sp.]|nr:tRNA lysidine(34) synthetase TilS [Treponema sp.]